MEIWRKGKKHSKRHGYHDRSPSIRNINEFLRFGGWKASKHSTLFAATVHIMPLVVQYFLQIKDQIQIDPTTVNISDDNFVTAFCYSKAGYVVRARRRGFTGSRKKNPRYPSKVRFDCDKGEGDDCWKEIRPWWPKTQSFLSDRTNATILIKPVKASHFYQGASLIAEEISRELRKRRSFAQICKYIFEQIRRCKQYVRGIRICCSGRLNGAEIAQTECMKEGSTSLHVFSDYIDYARAQTSTRYGILGVKVWISYSSTKNRT